MVTQELITYIRQRQSSGAKKEVIVIELIKLNWSQNDIIQAFSTMEQGNPALQKIVQAPPPPFSTPQVVPSLSSSPKNSMKQCKSCQSEIDSKAKKCPHCQSDQRNWFARHPILTGLLALFAIGIVVSAIGGASNTGKSTPAAPDNSGANTTNSNTHSNTQSQPTATQAAPQVLLDLTGSGSKSTQKFTAGGDWDLNWTYDCTNFGYKGNFQVYIYNGDGSMSLENTAINQLGMKDSGIEHYHKGGTYYLEVNSECSWTLQAKG